MIKKKMKRLFKTYYTDEPLKVTKGLFKTGILNEGEEMHNPVHFQVCTEKRHEECCKEKECDSASPSCENDKYHLLNMTSSQFNKLQHAVREQLLHEKLNGIFNQCRRVCVCIMGF